MTLITLTTDFGLGDEFVGVMKGVILGQAPLATIIDLCHAIPAQDIRSAAYLLEASYPYFPANTIHTVVVDPGVGGKRDIIVVQAHGQLFLAPDNGVLTPVLNTTATAFRLENPDIPLPAVSHTFHGRDIFAPCAAFLAGQGRPDELGSRVPTVSLRTILLPKPILDTEAGTISGQVTNIDHFGNLTTNITARHLASLCEGKTETVPVLHLGHSRIAGIKSSYQEVTTGQPLLIINSRNCLEVAINHGNAAESLEIGLDAPLELCLTDSVCE